MMMMVVVVEWIVLYRAVLPRYNDDENYHENDDENYDENDHENDHENDDDDVC